MSKGDLASDLRDEVMATLLARSDLLPFYDGERVRFIDVHKGTAAHLRAAIKLQEDLTDILASGKADTPLEALRVLFAERGERGKL